MEKRLLGKSSNSVEVYGVANNEHMKAHKDVTSEIISEAISKISINSPYLMKTVKFDRIIGKSNLVKINRKTDNVRMLKRIGRDGETPICLNKRSVDTNLLTIGVCKDDDGLYTVFTAFFGEKAPREPWDENIKNEAERLESEAFWKNHALSFEGLYGSIESCRDCD